MDLSTEELLNRKETLKQFDNYIEDTENTLKCFVEKVGWTLDKTPIKDNLVKCPINSEHRMSPSKLEVHCQKCILKKNGYDSSHSFYPSYNLSTLLSQTVTIDEITQMHILKTAYDESNSTLNINLKPREVSQSIERYVCDFTPDERRILYDSAVKYTKPPNYKDVKNDLTGVDFFNKTDDRPKTELELLQEQRDLKRRRTAYRGKRVHTDRKSYIEVLREVVEGLTNTLSHSEDESADVQTSNTVTETTPYHRFEYEGIKTYDGNPHTRWLNIEIEESKLYEYYQKKSESSHQEVSTSKIHCEDKTGFKRSRKSKSRSRERKTSIDELKLKRSRRSRSRSSCTETKFKRPKIRSKSKESAYIKSKHKRSRSRKHKTRSKSKESEPRMRRSRSISSESTHKRFKKRKTRSKSKELEKVKCSKSLTNYNKLENEKDSTISSHTHKKNKKHKSKKNRSKSPRKSHKNKKSDI
ncbi:U11/U12 small nuclear ribonucleoprotein 48 kDa protein-like [Aphis gossypii]|uniref:U11/U12 small nuclear ribonucleoprotein 48 kDa protein-like n=1 Tax=Aphis gossypii TaxID=80765 RepID=UPI00100DA613|nr:U11/U12 small nuclear ribonucleoprotein 48 kDa protein-like [Aphis gossypii]